MRNCLILVISLFVFSSSILFAQEKKVVPDTTLHSEVVSEKGGKELVRYWYEAVELDGRVREGKQVVEQEKDKSKSLRSSLRAIDTSLSAGSIPYDESVTATGAQLLSVPIYTSPVPSISPQIALTYNSQAGNGVAGYGWNVSGLSAITAVPKNIYYDSAAYPVDLDTPSNLAFALDGVRLVANTNTSMSAYQYVTATGFVYVKKVLVTSGSYAGQVHYFEALYPDGRTAVFGFPTDAQTNTLWCFPLTSVTDLRGYRVDVEYRYDSGLYHVSRINYGGCTSSTHPASIRFTYSSRQDTAPAFIAGRSAGETVLLTGIGSYEGSSLVRSYSLTHTVVAGFSQLTQIDCSAGSSSLNPLTFDYGTDGVMSNEHLGTFYSSFSVDVTLDRGRLRAGSFSDGMMIYPSSMKDQLYGVTASSGGYPVKYGSLVSSSQSLLVYPDVAYAIGTYSTLTAGSGFQSLAAVDIDGDGVDEVVRVNYGTATNSITNISVSRYSYSNLTQTQLSTLSFPIDGCVQISSYVSPIQIECRYGDFNGDGKVELAVLSADVKPTGESNTSRLVIVSLESGTKLCDVAVTGMWGNKVSTFDADGDGKTDFLTFTSTGYNVRTLQGSSIVTTLSGSSAVTAADISGALLGDFNADGLIDFVTPAPESYQDIRDVVMEVWHPATCPSCGGSEPIADDDADGECRHCGTDLKRYYVNHPSEALCRSCGSLLDIESYSHGIIFEATFTCPTHGLSTTVQVNYGYVDGGTSWTLHYNTGKSFSNTTFTLVRFNRGDKLMAADYDREGHADVEIISGTKMKVYRSVNGVPRSSAVVTATVGSSAQFVDMNAVHPGLYGGVYYINANHYVGQVSGSAVLPATRQMSGMTDSYGLEYTYEHNAIDDPTKNVFEDTGDSHSHPYSKVYAPLVVLNYEKAVEPATGQTVSSVLYKYGGPPVVHRTGLGFCGFERRTSTDRLTGMVRVETYNPELFGVTTSVVTKTTGGTQTGSSSYTWARNEGTNHVTNPRLTSSSETNSLTGVTVSSSYTYDSYNNPISVTASYGSALTESTVMTYSNTVSTSLYLTGLPLTRTVTRTRGSSVWKDKEVYTYGSNHLPATRITYTGTAGDQKTGETRWTYDGYGNVLTEKSAPYSATEFIGNTYTYDSAGRFVSTKTNALGQTTTYSSYNKFGLPAGVTDYRSRTTSFTYDDWGECTGETRPDGTSVQTTYGWETGSSSTYHYVQKAETGKPSSRAVYDAAGREYRSGSVRFDGNWQYVEKKYGADGLLLKESLPYKDVSGSDSTRYWNTYAYDVHKRPVSLTEASGRVSSWSYSGLSTTEVKEGVSSTRTADASGAIVSVTDAGGTITYTLRPDGQPSAVTAPGSVVTSFTYDAFGRRASIVDPSAGTRSESWTYASDGSSTHIQTNPNGAVTTCTDKYGRITSVVRSGEGTATYTYNSYGLLTQVSMTGGAATQYTYDTYDRPVTVKETGPDSKWLQKEYTYASGNVSTVKYTSQSGVITTATYTYSNGTNTAITLPGSVKVWQLTGENALGLPTAVTTGTVSRTYSYTAYGLPTGRTMGSVMNCSYVFNAATGNLTSRTDNTRSLTESFTYDSFNRLTGMGSRTVSYASNGNITSMTGVGSMSYGDSSHPYRITVYTPSTGADAVQMREQSASYSAIDRVTELSEGGRTAAFTYNAAGERVKMAVTDASGSVLTRYYLCGQYEYDSTSSGTVERLYLGGDAYSAPVVYQRENSGSWTLYNIGRDYLGSVTHIASAGGSLIAEYSYDPWGRMRNPAGQAIYAAGSEPEPMFGRGYTGHEHLTWFGLVNMNARLYDPAMGRFLSADPYVQAPDFTQNFNRYSYALNNPLKYSDPSGESLIIGAAIGAAIGLLSGYLIGQQHGATGWQMAGYIAGGGLIGGLSGLAGGLVSNSLASMAGAGFLGGAISGGASAATAGFISGTGLSMLGGDSLQQALWNGVKGAGIGFLVGGAIGGLSQGLSDLRHGGNFWTGEGAIEEFSGGVLPENLKVKLGDGMEYSNEYARKFADKNIGPKWSYGVDELNAEMKIPAGRGYEIRGDYVVKGDDIVHGLCIKGSFGKGSSVYLYKSAFTSKEMLYLSIGHEYFHSYLSSIGVKGGDDNHTIIYHWQATQANVWEISNSSIQYMKNYWRNYPYLDTGYSFFKIIIPIKPYWWRWIL